ncbi:response regulator transcription factor [Pseudonocardia halophobica]|uniref:response regulator transcription factor n=1 Tax=Pseudonocardia halophobica TaxID=29401 RepID=UPI003D921177
MTSDGFAHSLRAVASGGPVTRLRGVMELLCAETNLNVAQVNSIAPHTGEHAELVNVGHEDTSCGPLPVSPVHRSVHGLEILRLLATGLTNRQIGERLFLATRTVSTHVEHVLRKLGLSSRVQAATLAVRAGLLADP